MSISVITLRYNDCVKFHIPASEKDTCKNTSLLDFSSDGWIGHSALISSLFVSDTMAKAWQNGEKGGLEECSIFPSFLL